MVGLTARGWSDLPERLRATIQSAEVRSEPARLKADPIRPILRLSSGWSGRVPRGDGLPMLLSQVEGPTRGAPAPGDPLSPGSAVHSWRILGAAEVRFIRRVLGSVRSRSNGLARGVHIAGAAARGRPRYSTAVSVPRPPLDHLVARRRESRRDRSVAHR